MFKKFYLFLMTCLLGCFGEQTFAGPKLGVEPYLGYSQLNYTAADGTGGESTSDTKLGTVLGGKGGVYVTENIWGALDYHLGGPYKLENNDKEYLNRMWGIGAGYSVKGKGRVWVGYYFDAVMDDVELNYHLKGTAYKISGGLEIAPSVSFNIEYSLQQYKERSVGTVAGDNKVDFKVSVLYVSISAPIYLTK